MGCYLISEDLRDSIRYFLPVFCFALGVLTACFIRSKCRHTGKIHWRHLVLVMEILLLFGGRLSATTGKLAGKRAYLLCLCHAGAVLPHGQRQRLCQHHVYRQSAKWYGSSLPVYNREKERRRKNRSHLSDCYHLLCHWRSRGGHLTTYFSYRTIWISCGILILCFLLMLIEEEEDLEVLEKKERKELQAEKNLVKKEQEKLQEEKLLMKETENEFQQKISKG